MGRFTLLLLLLPLATGFLHLPHQAMPSRVVRRAAEPEPSGSMNVSRRSAIDAGAAALALLGTQGSSALAFGEEVTTASGLKYIDIATGPPQQPMPKPGSTVKIDFEGWTGGYDAERFTKGTTEARLDSGMLIAGIDEALHSMNIGSKRRLEIKPELAYGATGFPKSGDDAGTVVPPNTKIFFEIRLRSIKASPF
jgi:FKBP-type peptidyl-prolyl cis-trans isomerase